MGVAGLVLAGGRGTRLGGSVPKPLVDIAGTTPFAIAVERLSRACDKILVSANEPAAYRGFGLTVLPDLREGRLGPLAALEAAHHALSQTARPPTHLVCLPGDTPFLPNDVASRLIEGAGSLVRIAAFEDRTHPTVAIWPLAALGRVAGELDRADSNRSLMGLLRRLSFETLAFERDEAAPDGDPFFNVNTQDDLAKARRHRLSADRLGKAVP